MATVSKEQVHHSQISWEVFDIRPSTVVFEPESVPAQNPHPDPI